MVEAIESADLEGLSRLHISADWNTILRVALWTSGPPSRHDVFSLLKKAGITEDALSPFKSADVDDIFPWLYYGKRLDVLRRICNSAKARAESRISNRKLLVHCHIAGPDTGKIVASSL